MATVRWHESFSELRILALGRVLARHTIGCVGDEDHSASAQVVAVEEDDVMNLIDDRAERLSLARILGPGECLNHHDETLPSTPAVAHHQAEMSPHSQHVLAFTQIRRGAGESPAPRL